MTDTSHQRKFWQLRIFPLLLCAFGAGLAHAQDASVQVEQFLNAFRGKPVAPVMPVPMSAQTNSSLAAPGSSTTSTSQTPATAPRQDVTAEPPTCLPGVDRPDCPSPTRPPQQIYCRPGMAQGPNGCVPIAMPPNAHRASEDGQWQCDDGFLRYGAVCIPIQSSASH
jgi:hypothetical protein